MKINYKTVITDYDYKPAKDRGGKEDMMLGNMVITALNTVTPEDKALAVEKKIHRAVISQDIHNAIKKGGKGFVDLPNEDVVLIQKLIAPLYPPLALMRAWEILDPKPKDVEGKKSS